jgi:hypothetical protein
VLYLAAGSSYQAGWVNAPAGTVISSEKFSHERGQRTLTAPVHSVDAAVRVKRT